MNKSPLAQIARLKLLVGVLGEQSQFNLLTGKPLV